jgi:hypothetical protein
MRFNQPQSFFTKKNLKNYVQFSSTCMKATTYLLQQQESEHLQLFWVSTHSSYVIWTT